MTCHTFFCIDGHTCGNPVRVVTGGSVPMLSGHTMLERRQHFLAEFDWVRTSLMFEPRGHDMMSGSILYPPTRDDCDVGVLFIETSGCLPMCGHGTIGTVTFAIERGLVNPKTPGVVRLDTPAGVVTANYAQSGPYVDRVKITNVPSFLDRTGCETSADGLGPVTCDVAYGGNFYAIINPQPSGPFTDLAVVAPDDIIRWSRQIREDLNKRYRWEHPTNPEINRVTHVMWTGEPKTDGAHARNAVIYGDKAIDRSPCGTGTSARMAQWHAQQKLSVGDTFVHESIIGSLFTGRVEAETKLADRSGIVPSIEGWARVTGFNTIFVDDRDPYWQGFQVV